MFSLCDKPVPLDAPKFWGTANRVDEVSRQGHQLCREVFEQDGTIALWF